MLIFMLLFLLMVLVVLRVMWLLVVWCYLWLRWIRLKVGFWVGGGPWRPKVMHWVRLKTADWRSFGSTPRVGFHSHVNRWALEHGTFVLWPLKLCAFYWRALEWWHHFHGVLVNWRSLHTAVTRVLGTTTPLQLCDCFMCHLVDWFVQLTIPEGNNQLLVRNIHLPVIICTLK